MSTRTVFVTGGAGFLGAEVVRRLCAARIPTHVLVRARTDRSLLSGLDVTYHPGDLEDEASVRRALTAASARGELELVHLAARISYRRADADLLERVNVGGTRCLLDAARVMGVRRFCHVSSVVALGPVARFGNVLGDDAPLRGQELDSAYASTKARAEELALAARELDVVVASPAVVFGVSRASNSSHFLRRVVAGQVGRLRPPGSLTVVGVADAADGILRVLERGRRGQRYLLGESVWRLGDLLELACELAGRPTKGWRVPVTAWRLLTGVAEVLDRVHPLERATPEALALLARHFCFRCERARSELGWQPRAFREVLRELLAALEASP